MLGAQNISCVCGGFLTSTYTREVLGKIERLYECECGRERTLTVDGDVMTLETKNHGVVEELVKIRGNTKKIFRYPLPQRYRTAHGL